MLDSNVKPALGAFAQRLPYRLEHWRTQLLVLARGLYFAGLRKLWGRGKRRWGGRGTWEKPKTVAGTVLECWSSTTTAPCLTCSLFL
jgi:hypothetical protein